MIAMTAILLFTAMLTVIVLDVTRYIIPNWLVGLLLLYYPLWVIFAPTEPDWLWALPAAAIYLLIGFAFFSFGLMGAGDAKLLAVLALYIGWSTQSVYFFLLMTVIGGIFSIFIVIMRRILKYSAKKPKLLTPKAPVPYGVAIALAFLLMLMQGHLEGIPAPDISQLF